MAIGGGLKRDRRHIMTQYRNLSGDSGVVAYEISDGSIEVQFSDGSVYLYTNDSAGGANIEKMQRLAEDGEGLTSFINRLK